MCEMSLYTMEPVRNGAVTGSYNKEGQCLEGGVSISFDVPTAPWDDTRRSRGWVREYDTEQELKRYCCIPTDAE